MAYHVENKAPQETPFDEMSIHEKIFDGCARKIIWIGGAVSPALSANGSNGRRYHVHTASKLHYNSVDGVFYQNRGGADCVPRYDGLTCCTKWSDHLPSGTGLINR